MPSDPRDDEIDRLAADLALRLTAILYAIDPDDVAFTWGNPSTPVGAEIKRQQKFQMWKREWEKEKEGDTE